MTDRFAVFPMLLPAALAALIAAPAAAVPFTLMRGDANQFVVGLGVGYTF